MAACSLALTALTALTFTAADSAAAYGEPNWTVTAGRCSTQDVWVPRTVSSFEVVLEGAPGAGAWGIAGGGGNPGGLGGVVRLTLTQAQLRDNGHLRLFAGCTPWNNAGGTGYATGGASQAGGGAGGGSSAVCLGDSCELLAVAGGGGGGGGGTCAGKYGWAGGAGGSGTMHSDASGTWVDGGDGVATPGSGGKTANTWTSQSGQSWQRSAATGGLAGGGAGYPRGGTAGKDWGAGCQSHGGGGGGSSWLKGGIPGKFYTANSTSGRITLIGYDQNSDYGD